MDLGTGGNYADLASAQVAASILESAGIECVIPDENLAGIAWQMGSAQVPDVVEGAADD